MNTRIICQPNSPLGNEIAGLLVPDMQYSRIVFVSAFVALRTVLRLREQLLSQRDGGALIRLTIGIDLGGTSREVLDELLSWGCETFIFHNPIPRATFHPKVYLFENDSHAVLFVGSNNLTDGGLFSNYEVATRYDVDLPDGAEELNATLASLDPFINPVGGTVQVLTSELIETLAARGQIVSEKVARSHDRRRTGGGSSPGTVPENPFSPVHTPFPPLLPANLRPADTTGLPSSAPVPGQPLPTVPPSAHRVLVWRKELPKSDALQVEPGSHHVGGVRLTQAKFENPPGQQIDQTTYFRQLFGDYEWSPEPRGYVDQEHAFVPMRIVIRNTDYGIRNFEISHKPTGEAGQANYTTILRWGRAFVPTVTVENLTGTTLSIYETDDPDTPFLIEITD